MSKYLYRIMHLPIQRYLKWWLNKYSEVKEKIFVGISETNPAYLIDCLKRPFLKFIIEGDTEQFSTSGANLINCDNPLTVDVYKDVNCTLEAGTYTISCSEIQTTGTDTSVMVQVQYTDSTNDYFTMETASKKGTLTLTKTSRFIRFYSQNGYQSSVGITTTFKDIMLNTGTTALDYEPYTRWTSKPFSFLSTGNK